MPRYSDRIGEPYDVVLFGAASALGSVHANCRHGPYFIRRLSQAYAWQSKQPTLIDLRSRALRIDSVFDAGDFVPDADLRSLHQELFDFVLAMPHGSVPIVIGGDHSITLPVISAVGRKEAGPLKVVIFDHHLDLQYWSRSLEAPFNTNVMSHIANVVGDGRLVHLGVASVQTISAPLREWYLRYLEQVGVQVPLLSHDIANDDFIATAVGTTQNVYLSIDVDVLSRSQMVSTGYPSDEGLPLSRVVELIRLIAATNRVVGCDLVEFSAPKDDRSESTLSDAGRAAILLLELIVAAAGEQL